MSRRLLPAVLILASLVGLHVVSAESPQPQGQGGRGGGRGAAPPRARSVTLGDVTAFEVANHVATVSAGADQVRVMFYRDEIFRLWLGPDGEFAEAQPETTDAQMVVCSGDPIAFASRDAGDYYRIESTSLVLRVYKRPLRFAMFDKTNTKVIWQETKPLT